MQRMCSMNEGWVDLAMFSMLMWNKAVEGVLRTDNGLPKVTGLGAYTFGANGDNDGALV